MIKYTLQTALKIEEPWKRKKDGALKLKPNEYKKENALKIEEHEKQKKQVRPRIKVVSRQRNEPELSPDIPARLKNRILGELKGTGLRLVVEKPLYTVLDGFKRWAQSVVGPKEPSQEPVSN